MNKLDTVVKLTGLKRAMARNMINSWTDVPQFQLESEVNCDFLIMFRESQEYRLSYTAIIAKTIAKILIKYPIINSSWAGDHIIQHEQINIGIATDTKRGLLIPVIRDVSNKSLLEIQDELNRIKEKTMRGNFSLEEMSGGTFTISNLGMYRINTVNSVVNTPETGILSVGRMQKVPIVDTNNGITVASIIRPVLTLDHRVVDGATGARFLTQFVEVLENPKENLL